MGDNKFRLTPLLDQEIPRSGHRQNTMFESRQNTLGKPRVFLTRFKHVFYLGQNVEFPCPTKG